MGYQEQSDEQLTSRYIIEDLRQRIIELETYVAEIEQMETTLRSNLAHFAGILEIAAEAIISVNEAQQIVLFNSGAEQIFGYSADEALGLPLDILIPESLVAVHRQHIAEFGQSATSTRLMGERQEILGLRKDGHEFPAEASISKSRVDNVLYFTVVLRDITARKQMEIKREHLIADLHAFAHTISHGLKTPLGLIIGFAHILKEKARLTEELQPHLEAIIRNGYKMNNIVDEMQVLAGVRQAKVDLKPINMGRIVAEAQQRLTYMIEEYQAELRIPQAWPIVLGHAPWVEEVWANYLSNGIKYGGQPPRLQLGATTRSDGTVRFWVRDNGPGIPPEAQSALFKPFIQLSQARTEGQGLGLSIVRQIVERLGGRVGVESEGRPGQGTVFSFTLKQAFVEQDVL